MRSAFKEYTYTVYLGWGDGHLRASRFKTYRGMKEHLLRYLNQEVTHIRITKSIYNVSDKLDRLSFLNELNSGELENKIKGGNYER